MVRVADLRSVPISHILRLYCFKGFGLELSSIHWPLEANLTCPSAPYGGLSKWDKLHLVQFALFFWSLG